ncbi:MAG: DNA repair protein RecN [Alphaproteobacteria bacterium]
MLHNLTIRNYLFVDDLQLDFHPGFTVLTGETGAGKSIVLEALNLILGGRAPQRPVHDLDTEITGCFKLAPPLSGPLQALITEHNFLAPDQSFTLKRIISKNAAKSGSFLNDQRVNLNLVKEISACIIDIHGQFDNLLAAETHVEILDTFGQLLPQVQDLEKKHTLWKHTEKQLEILRNSIHALHQEKEWLDHTVAEFQKISPQENEESSLLEKRIYLMNFEKTAETLKTLRGFLGEESDLETSLKSANRLLNKLPESETALGKCRDLTETMLDYLNEIHQELHTLEGHLEGSLDDKLNELESRLFQLRDLARKHHCTVDELPGMFESLKAKITTLSQGTISVSHLEEQTQLTKAEYEKLAMALSSERRAKAKVLREKIKEILSSLKLPQVDFQVHFAPLPDHQWTSRGTERIEFWVSLNPGLSAGPLKAVASGGELSRLMLALKVLLKDQTALSTLIFDEIDTGLGGAVAAAMGKYLKQISKGTQVIAITHSPQLAAYGDQHLRVEKTSTLERTMATLVYLNSEEEKSNELARMLSGREITNQTKATALELRQGALNDHSL